MIKIKITYTTGDSFRSNIETDEIEGSWDNVEIVKENILRIKEHYKAVQNIESYTTLDSEKKSILRNVKKQRWFVKDTDKYDEFWKRRLYLLLDNGTEYIVSAFWSGYFEELHEVEGILTI